MRECPKTVWYVTRNIIVCLSTLNCFWLHLIIWYCTHTHTDKVSRSHNVIVFGLWALVIVVKFPFPFPFPFPIHQSLLPSLQLSSALLLLRLLLQLVVVVEGGAAVRVGAVVRWFCYCWFWCRLGRIVCSVFHFALVVVVIGRCFFFFLFRFFLIPAWDLLHHKKGDWGWASRRFFLQGFV